MITLHRRMVCALPRSTMCGAALYYVRHRIYAFVIAIASSGTVIYRSEMPVWANVT